MMVRILIIDDDLAMSTMVGDLLETAGYSILIAQSGIEGVEMAVG